MGQGKNEENIFETNKNKSYEFFVIKIYKKGKYF
jgi:hypothetical protein